MALTADEERAFAALAASLAAGASATPRRPAAWVLAAIAAACMALAIITAWLCL